MRWEMQAEPCRIKPYKEKKMSELGEKLADKIVDKAETFTKPVRLDCLESYIEDLLDPLIKVVEAAVEYEQEYTAEAERELSGAVHDFLEETKCETN